VSSRALILSQKYKGFSKIMEEKIILFYVISICFALAVVLTTEVVDCFKFAKFAFDLQIHYNQMRMLQFLED
jgi:hypothetical protein